MKKIYINLLCAGELNEQAELTGRKDLRQSKGAARLFSRVNKMLNSINAVVENLEVCMIKWSFVCSVRTNSL